MQIQDISGMEIEGDDQLAHEIGAAVRRSRGRGMNPNIKASGHGHHLVEDSDTKIRRQICPLPSTTMGAAPAQATITVLPQRTFKLTALVLVEGTNFDHTTMVILDLKVGAETQFINDGSCPFQAFYFTSTQSQLTGNTANAGRNLSLVVSSITGGGTPIVTGVFFGPAVEGI